MTCRTLKVAGVFVVWRQERLLNYRLPLIAREMLLSHSHFQRATNIKDQGYNPGNYCAYK